MFSFRMISILLCLSAPACDPRPEATSQCDCAQEFARLIEGSDQALQSLITRVEELEQRQLNAVSRRDVVEDSRVGTAGVDGERRVDDADSRRALAGLEARIQSETAEFASMSRRLAALEQKSGQSRIPAGDQYGEADRIKGDVEELKRQFQDLPRSHHRLDQLADVPRKLDDLDRRLQAVERRQ